MFSITCKRKNYFYRCFAFAAQVRRTESARTERTSGRRYFKWTQGNQNPRWAIPDT